MGQQCPTHRDPNYLYYQCLKIIKTSNRFQNFQQHSSTATQISKILISLACVAQAVRRPPFVRPGGWACSECAACGPDVRCSQRMDEAIHHFSSIGWCEGLMLGDPGPTLRISGYISGSTDACSWLQVDQFFNTPGPLLLCFKLFQEACRVGAG